MNVLLLEQEADRPESLAERLRVAKCHVVARVHELAVLEMELDHRRADIIVVDLVAPDVDLVRQVGVLGQRYDEPVAVFVEKTDMEMTHAALAAGISSYVVRGSHVDRLRDALQVARARFEADQKLRNDLASARSSLADRKIIEQAKGRLMKNQGLDEDAAYRALRDLAMRRKSRIIDIARAVLDRLDK